MKKTEKEIKEILKSRASSVVDERVLPSMYDEVGSWTEELMGKLTTLDAQADRSLLDNIYDTIYYALVEEAITQLERSLRKSRVSPSRPRKLWKPERVSRD